MRASLQSAARSRILSPHIPQSLTARAHKNVIGTREDAISAFRFHRFSKSILHFLAGKLQIKQ
ncbi:hypothetical protein G3N92_05270 [Burkholderia sp. Ac-20379]|nr:hypothetical protein [Burkholderia sp. Ac-20379]